MNPRSLIVDSIRQTEAIINLNLRPDFLKLSD